MLGNKVLEVPWDDVRCDLCPMNCLYCFVIVLDFKHPPELSGVPEWGSPEDDWVVRALSSSSQLNKLSGDGGWLEVATRNQTWEAASLSPALTCFLTTGTGAALLPPNPLHHDISVSELADQ